MLRQAPGQPMERTENGPDPVSKDLMPRHGETEGFTLRVRISCAWISPVLAILLSVAAPSFLQWCCAEASDSPWIENTELRAVRTAHDRSGTDNPGAGDSGAANPGAGNSGADNPGVASRVDAAPVAEVFDSRDYQCMLVLQRAWPDAYVLDLATGEVFVHPVTEVITAEGRLQAPAAGTPAGSFIADPEGNIRFGTIDQEIVVEPLPPLVGALDRSELDRRQPVYSRRAAAYQPDAAAVSALRAVGEPIEIIAFFGTWCQTCKQSLPALLSTLDRANNPNFHLHLVGTDENMSEPADWIMEWALDYTPTYIVLQGDTELGRIEEEPLVSMEADLLEIIERGSQR